VPVADDGRELAQRLSWGGNAHYRAVIPPSITSSLPLTKRPSSDAMKAIPAAGGTR
jgi:hypothetical protein